MISQLDDSASGDIGLRPMALIPSNEMADFYQLTQRNQNLIRQWLTAMRIVEASPSVMTGFEQAARHFAGERGFSAKNVCRRYYEWRASGWRSLINWTFEPAKSGQPREFLDYFQLLCEQNQRCTSQAITRLYKEWRDGVAIPGYGTWRAWWAKAHPGQTPPPFCPGYPRGWHKANLHKLAPTRYELKAARVGRSAADSERRLVYTTRRNLWVGSHYQLDDMWHNLMVNCLRERKAGRPLELFSHDLYSGRKVRWGFRVRTKGDDGKYAALTEPMTRLIIAATLYCDGYSPRGTTFVAEHGTAAIRDRVEDALWNATTPPGLITVSRSGMKGAEAHAGQYPGLARGNFRSKASLESHNNLTQNVFGDLPGQTGRNVENRPEQLHGLLENNQMLLAAYEQLPPDRAALLEFPLLTTAQFHQIASDYYDIIDNMTDHRLEGFGAVAEYQLAGQWHSQHSLLALPESEQQMAIALLQSGKISTRQRKLSRREVWLSGASELRPVAAPVVCDILGEDLAQERPVRRQMFEFRDAEISPDPLRYSALIRDIHGRERLLRDGEKFQTFVNPFAPDMLFVRDAKGRYIGEAARIESVDRADTEALHRACGAAAKGEVEALQPLRARHMAEARQKAARARNNARVVNGTAPRASTLPDDFSQTTTQHPTHDDGPDAGDLADAIIHML